MRLWQASARALSRAFDAVQDLYVRSSPDDCAGRDALLKVQDSLIVLMRENDAQLRGLLEEVSAGKPCRPSTETSVGCSLDAAS